MLRLWILLLICTLTGCSEVSEIIIGDVRPQTPEGQALYSVARKETFRAIRSSLKSYAEKQFGADPSMRFEEYEKHIIEIHSIGEKFNTEDEAESDFRIKSQRNFILHRKHLTEDPNNLVRWGPLFINDEGSIRFSMLSCQEMFSSSDSRTFEASFVNVDKKPQPGLVYGEWKFSASVDIQLDPFRAIQDEEISGLGRKFGLTLKADHPIGPHHNKFSIENQFETNGSGESGYYLNFIWEI